MRKIKNKKIDISLGKAKSIIFSPMITEKSTRIKRVLERDPGRTEDDIVKIIKTQSINYNDS